MKRAKELSLVLLTAAVIFFAVQNYASMGEVAFLWFEFTMPISLIAMVPLLVGLLVGAGSALVFGHRKGKRAREKERERMQEMQMADAEEATGEDDEPGKLTSGEPAAPPVEDEARSERAT